MSDKQKICGSIRADGTECPLTAGFRTTHPGKGKCIYCSTEGDGEVSFIRLTDLDKVDSSLAKSIRDASDLPNSILYGQDVLLKLLWGILDHTLVENHRAFTPEMLTSVVDLIQKIVTMQRGKQIIDKDKLHLEEMFAEFIKSNMRAMVVAGIDRDKVEQVFKLIRKDRPDLFLQDQELKQIGSGEAEEPSVDDEL
jgi:hypothetical protein